MAYQSKSYNFILRLITACVLAPLVLCIIKLSGYAFLTMIMAGAIIMGGEWSQITYHKSKAWKLMGIPYILIPCICLLWIIEQNDGVRIITSIFVLVWANDIGGYVFGKLIGGYKLCPKISPNKTISGFVGGVVCAMAFAPLLENSFIFAIIVAIVASIGDLLESWIKRRCRIKDSGSIIPGHGGLLDRVDGILLVSVMLSAVMML